MIPTEPGFYWYRQGGNWSNRGSVWCVKVEYNDWQEPILVGWVPAMDYCDPMTAEYWNGEWFGRATPPPEAGEIPRGES